MPHRISSPVLVGRDADLAVLAGELEASAAGSPRFVIVRGESGIGKSRLVAEATNVASGAGAIVLVGECLDVGRAGLPYLPIAAALRGLARSMSPDALDRLLGPARRELASLAPELASLVPELDPARRVPPTTASGPTDAVAVPGELPAGLGQARLFERVLGLIGALSAAGPTILVVEDVHWIDRATRDLLTFVSRNLTTERLAVVLTCRAEDLPRGHPIGAWLAEIERVQPTTVLELERLGRDAVERQLRVIGGGESRPAVTERIWQRSEGNPLLVEELFASPEGDAPRSLVEVLLARVVRLDPASRTLVDAVAVAGRPADERLLAEVLAIPEAEVDERLRAALAHGVLEALPSAGGYRFRHELLREVVEAELLPGTRRRLHERFARSLTAHPELADPSPAGAAAELAHHSVEAGLEPEAFERSIAAARAAEAVHAHADAHRHWERALALEPHDGDTARRLDIRRRAADAADLGGDVERALELTREALLLVDAGTDPTTAGLLHSRTGYLQWALGDGASALLAHREAVRLVPADVPTPERARVLASLGGALMGIGRWAESREVCEAAIQCAAAAGAPGEESRARNMLGSDLVALGEIEAGIAQLEQACRLAAQGGAADGLIVGYYNLGLNLATTDRLPEALAAAGSGRAAARDAGLERRYGQDLAALHGDILLRLGRVDEALDALSAGLALAPVGARSVYLSAVRGRASGIRGEIADVERRLGGLDLRALDPDVAAYVADVLAEAMAWADRPAEALAVARAGIRELAGLDDVLWTAPLVAHGLRAAAELAEEARARRSDARDVSADESVTELREHLERLARRVTTASGRGWVALARAELGRAAGGDAAADWRAAIEAFDAVPDPLDAAYARFRAAEASLRAEGVRADVGDLVADAAAVAEAAGARPLATAVATLAARARITPRTRGAGTMAGDAGASGAGTTASGTGTTARPGVAAPPSADADPRVAAAALGLSAREIEVLALVAAGLSNGEIAERLFITRKTAAVHVTHILDKLDVPNRVGAAMIAARVGLVAPPAPDAPDYSE